MSFLDEVREDCQAAENDLGDKVVTWNEFDYPCAPTLIKRGTTVVVGGREVEISLTLRVRNYGTKSSGEEWNFLSGAPKSGQRVTYETIIYRILRVGQAHGSFMEWDLTEKDR